MGVVLIISLYVLAAFLGAALARMPGKPFPVGRFVLNLIFGWTLLWWVAVFVFDVRRSITLPAG